MTTPTLEARLAELLPLCTWATDCASYAQKTGRTDITPCRPCRDRSAILTLIRTLLREERERCAEIVDENPFDGSGDKCIARTIRNLGDRE